MDMTESNLYAGIAEVLVPEGTFQFGEGVTLAPAHAHLMRPFLMTFRRPDSSFPGMMSASGSFGFDVVAEFFFPKEFQRNPWFDRLNSVWWLTALLRLRATPLFRVPVLSNASFSALALSSKQSFWPVELEAERTRLLLEPNAPDSVSTHDLIWVREHWLSAARLMHESREFNVLFQAFDQSSFARDPLLALLLMWSALSMPNVETFESDTIYRIDSELLQLRLRDTYLNDNFSGIIKLRVYNPHAPISTLDDEVAAGILPGRVTATYSTSLSFRLRLIHLHMSVYAVDGKSCTYKLLL
jgi:hypothetical protein